MYFVVIKPYRAMLDDLDLDDHVRFNVFKNSSNLSIIFLITFFSAVAALVAFVFFILVLKGTLSVAHGVGVRTSYRFGSNSYRVN